MKKLLLAITVVVLVGAIIVSANSQNRCKELPEGVQGPEEYCGQPLIYNTNN